MSKNIVSVFLMRTFVAYTKIELVFKIYKYFCIMLCIKLKFSIDIKMNNIYQINYFYTRYIYHPVQKVLNSCLSSHI